MADDLSAIPDSYLESAANSAPDLSKFSDEDLQKVAGKEPPSRTESALRGAAQGVTLGYEPWIAGALKAAGMADPSGGMGFPVFTPPPVFTPQDAYKEFSDTTAAEKAANKAAFDAHPGYNIAGNVAGGVANPIARLPVGLASGAAMGAIQGSSEGDSYGERAKNAVEGGVSGGILGKMFGNVFGGMNPTTRTAVENAKKIGVDIPYYAASPNLAVHSAANVVKNIPIVGTPVEEAAQKSIAQMGRAADNLSGVTPEAAGGMFGDSIKKWVTKDSRDLANKFYTNASAGMNPNILTPLNETANTVSQIMAKRTEAAIDGPSGAAKMVLPAIQRPGGLSYEGLKNLRTSIGEQLQDGILPPDVSGAELKRIYGALSTDLDAAATNAGGQTGQQLHNLANQAYSAISKKREALLPLIGGNKASASNENVFGNIVQAASAKSGSANIDVLRQAKSVMSPQDWQTASGGAIAHMGRDADGNFSPARFLGPNGFNKLSPAGKDILFGPVGTQTRDSLETLADVSRRFGAVQKYANTSGTAHAVVGAEGLRALRDAPLTVLTNAIGGRQVAQMISNPATTPALANWSQAYINNLRNAPVASALGLASEGTARGSLAALKAATQNLATIHARESGQAIAGLTKGIWSPVTNYLGLTGDDAILGGKADGGRVERQSGGRVKSHTHLVNRLVRLADAAKRASNRVTEPLLNAPDDSIVQALHVAQKAI